MRQSHHSAVGIRHGNSIWNEFCEKIDLYHPQVETVVMFDQHDVIDTLCDWDVAVDVAVDVDHFDPVLPLVCSFGRDHRAETFRKEVAWAPFVAECEGYIFTDYRQGHYGTIDIYRDSWMGQDTIGVRGDKGQVASLFGKPVLLFDDKEENIELLRARSSCQCPLDGVVVRRGKKTRWSVYETFCSSSNPKEWIDIMRHFNLTRKVP